MTDWIVYERDGDEIICPGCGERFPAGFDAFVGQVIPHSKECKPTEGETDE